MSDKRPEGGLLQSKEWAHILQEEKKEIITINTNSDNFFGVVQEVPLVGKYVYFPRMKNINDSFVEKISGLNFGWVRVDVDNENDLAVLKKSQKKSIQSPHNMQPKENFIISITKDDDELLAQMKSKTRYNVRLAQKKGVEIILSKDEKYVNAFYQLIKKTAERKGVTFHEKIHYEKILSGLSDEMVALYSAEYDGQIIAANLVSYYGDVATYLHGATANEHRNVMAPFLLQWKILQDAKERGCEWYDFGGVFPDTGDPGKKGITRFKRGFAPQADLYFMEGSYDVILSQWRYSIYKILQRFRKFI